MKTQILLLVTSNVKDFYKLKNCIHFRKRGKSDSKFENNTLEWSLKMMVIDYNKMKNYTI